MHFLKGIHKTATFARHSDGTEFKTMDTEPAVYAAGQGNLAPAGIAAHQASGTKNPKTKKTHNAALALVLAKEAGINGTLDYVGTRSDAADTLTTQLKWDQSSPDIVETSGYNVQKDSAPGGKKKMKILRTFEKSASFTGALKRGLVMGKQLIRGGKNSGGALRGIGQAGNDTLKSALNPMTGVRHLQDAAKAQGGFVKGFSSRQGRMAMGEALGRAAPSLAAGGAYAYGAKKVYDKTIGDARQEQPQQVYYGY